MKITLEHQASEAGLVSGDKLLVAVSGGVDSVVLLHLLHELAGKTGLQLQVAHLDHQLRPESAADADFVRQLCAKLNTPCVVESRDVSSLSSVQGISLEMAGRQSRREFLQRIADVVGARLIALAHHRDDQVETFMLRLLRGTGVAGLAAMSVQQGRWWRPLLEYSREQVLDYAQQLSLEWVEDASNADPIFLRNRLRHQLLPQMQDINPRFAERLAGLCCQLRVDEDYWQPLVGKTLPSLIVSSHDGLRLDREKLLALPEALRIRVIRDVLRQVRGDLHRLEAVHLRAVDELLSGERSQAQLDLPGGWVARRYDALWVRKKAPLLVAEYDLLLPVPGNLKLPCGRTLRTQLVAESTGESAQVAEFVGSEITVPLRVRNWRSGDFFEPQGMVGSKKLKRLFGDQKVELEERSRTPLLVSGERILWVAGFRRSRQATVAAGVGEIVRLELL